MELWIELNGKDAQHLYEQIYSGIRTEIYNGKLKKGDKIPSTRKLSDHLKVSRSTIALAYDQLVAEGYIEAIPCKGYFVSQLEDRVRVELGKAVSTLVEKKPNNYIDFTPRGIDLGSFPYQQWRKIYRQVLNEANSDLFQSGEQQGEYELRNALRGYLYSARGVNCESEQIIIGAGSEYLLMLLSRILDRDRVIAMENPTHKQAFRVFESIGYPVIPISMDQSGIEIEPLSDSSANLAYVMPSHQYPTGIVMPIKRRIELLRWAEEAKGRYIIEDDYDSEFRYRGKPIPALQGMDGSGCVIYLGTFSKSIAPAIRVSYLVLPQLLLERYHQLAGFFSSTVSRIDQQMLYQFIVQGYFERHLNRMRTIYKNKQGKLLEELKRLTSKFTISGANAGSHVLLVSKDETSEEILIEKAFQHGIKVYGMEHWSIVGDYKLRPTIVLGYASLTEEEIEIGIRTLEQVW